MNKLLKELSIAMVGLLIAATTYATVATPSQGGTGKGSASPSDIGKVLVISSSSPFTYSTSSNVNLGSNSLTAGKIGVGVASPSYGIDVFDAQTATTGTKYAANIGQSFTPATSSYDTNVNGQNVAVYLYGSATSSANGFIRGFIADAATLNGGAINSTYGVTGASGVGSGSTSTITNAYGLHGYVHLDGTGTITNVFPSFSECRTSSTGVMGTCVGFYSDISGSASSTITNYIGLKVVPDTQGIVSNFYGALIGGKTRIGDNVLPVNMFEVNGTSTFFGKVGIGTSTPATALHVVGYNTSDGFIAASSTATSTYAGIIQVTPTINHSASVSTGGVVNITNSSNTGVGLEVYSTQSTPAGRLVVFNSDNPAFNQDTLRVISNGNNNAVAISHTGTNTNSVGLNITSSGNGDAANFTETGTSSSASALQLASTNAAESTLSISGVETGRGTIKVTHTATSGDANSSGLSIDLAGDGTAAQGIFVTAGGGTGTTTGNLLTLRNENNDYKMVVGPTGKVGIATSTPLEKLDVNGYALFQNPYGSIAEYTGATSTGSTITMTNQNQFYAWKGATTTLTSVSGAGYITASTTGATSTINIGANGAGVYQIQFAVSAGVNTTNDVIHFAAFKNGVELQNVVGESNFANANDTRNISGGPGYVSLAAGDVIDLRCSDESSTGKVITVDHINFGISRVSR